MSAVGSKNNNSNNIHRPSTANMEISIINSSPIKKIKSKDNQIKFNDDVQ